jgi:Carbohydrate-selective porin, OprB family
MKKRSRLIKGGGFLSLICLLVFQGKVSGYDINDKFSIGGILAGVYQYQWADGDDDQGRGAVPFQPEFSFRPTGKDEIFAKFGFAAGNGLNGVTAFNLAPWAADLEDDVKDINGSNRDYLLTVWYKHTFEFSEDHSLGLTGGIIDATDYVDQNAYANCEYTQFMNQALVNGPNGFAPSYDIGGAVEWEISDWTITAVGMNVTENDDGNSYNFFGAQIGYEVDTSLGEGHYRVILEAGSNDFLDNNGEKEDRSAVFLSFDQELGDIFGVWIRFGWQDDKAFINYDALYSGGLNITGKWYGCEDDNIGIGYAYLDGDEDSDFDDTQVTEIYWRFVLNDYFALTADLQYMKEKYENDEEDIDGFILGLRGVVEF